MVDTVQLGSSRSVTVPTEAPLQLCGALKHLSANDSEDHRAQLGEEGIF